VADRNWTVIDLVAKVRLVLHPPLSAPRPRSAGRPAPASGISPRAAAQHAARALPHARLGTGVLLTGLVLAGVGALTHSTLVIAPFAATATLKHAAPSSPLVQPRNIVGGYLTGAAIGLSLGLLLGGGALAAVAAAALAAVVMLALRIEHPPAVAMAVVALQTPSPAVLQVAAAGAITMTLTMAALAPLLHRHRYPLRPVR
jgi:CBS-domain-containing membrane protein